MGADLAAGHAFETEPLPRRARGRATPRRPTRARRRPSSLRRRVDLILFAGGDGTARDIHDVSATGCRSSASRRASRCTRACSPRPPRAQARSRPRSLAAGPRARLREAEVVDVDEDAVRAGTIATRLYGAARVPDDRLRVQGAKGAPSPPDEVALDAVCARSRRRWTRGASTCSGRGRRRAA